MSFTESYAGWSRMTIMHIYIIKTNYVIIMSEIASKNQQQQEQYQESAALNSGTSAPDFIAVSAVLISLFTLFFSI
jgi:hypothetical protein